ncbi:MAG: hypothetical protein KJ566_00705 [Nanoarchaeota archaeon]|nr:hypothetical protein [Nanoarchaeota archaeon]
MSLKKLAFWSAIIGAIIYVFYSTLNLIGFAINQKAIEPTINGIVLFFANNFNFLFCLFLILIFITNIVIYSGFIQWSSKKKQKASLIFSIVFLAFASLSIISTLFSFSPTFFRVLLAISYVLFGISLLNVKQNRKTILLALSCMYIVQGIFIILAFFTFSQLVELTVGIKILEAVFFHFNK